MRAKKRQEDWTGQIHLVPGPKLIELEKDTQEQIRLAVEACGVMVMRNNNGVAKFGKHWVRYGLGNGSADLILCVPPHGRLCGIEVKRPKGGVESERQRLWHEHIRMMGGVAGFARNITEALKLVAEARELPRAHR